MSADAAAPSWAQDVIYTELQRRFPKGLSKEELQEATGAGTDDLRAAIAAMEDAGVLTEFSEDGADGWAIVEQADGTAVPPGGLEEDDGPDAHGQDVDGFGAPSGDDAAPVEAAEERERGNGPVEAAVGVGGPYRARLTVDVLFYPEPEGATSPDAQAVVDADEFLAAAQDGIRQRWADLNIGGAVDAVEVFDLPRKVWP